MASLDTASIEDLREALAEVEGKKPTQRLMAAINYLEEDDATMAEVAERYGYTGPWLSQWVDRLDRLAVVPKRSSANESREIRRPNSRQKSPFQ